MKKNYQRGPLKARHRDINLELWQGDARKAMMRKIVPGDVQCAITSPPYFGMRVYETGNELEIGREDSLDEYVWNLVDTFNALKRVLADDGIFWLNIADCYANSNRRGHKFPSERSTLTAFRNGNRPPTHQEDLDLLGDRKRPGWYRPKQLIPVAWTVAMALQDEGWFLRAANIWHKPNVVPTSARDRPGLDYEYVFMLTKQPRYTYYPDAVKQPAKWERWGKQTVPKHEGTATAPGWIQEATKEEVQAKGGGLRNLRTVWTIPTSNYPGQHFATFPEELVRRCISASTKPGDLVLDPFVGSGTTAAVALDMGRRAFGIDLVKEYLDQAVVRCGVYERR